MDRGWTIPAALAATARRHGDALAIDDSGVRLTWGEVHDQSRRATKAFVAAGIEAGETIAIWAPNIHEWMIAALGIQTAGAILVPISTRMKGLEAADVLRQSGARVLICIGEFLGVNFPDLLRDQPLPALKQIVVLRGSCADPAGWIRFLEQGTAVPDEVIEARIAALRGEDLSDILYTSGTTGRPKGVMTTHGQNLRAFEYWSGKLGLSAGDRYLVVNPFFHSAGYKAGWLASLIRGAAIMPQQVFDAEEALSRIAAERISFLLGPPTLYLTLLSHPRRNDFDLSSLRVAVTGAATVPPALVHRMRDELGFRTVVTAYGLTECCGFATICDCDDDPEIVASTCGHAIDGVEVRCVDAQGNTAASGEPGEVLIRGYNVMQGYLNDEKATREAIDSQGWLHTGDVGIVDARGYLRITDRLKDMFIVGGFNCYPAEIERLCSAHPAVAQVAVIGVPDERLGEVGHAYVVLRHAQQISAVEFISWCRAQMANYKVPRRVDIVPNLPLNAAGKVDKLSLRRTARIEE